MLAVYEVPIRVASLVFLMLAPMLLLPMAVLHYRRYGRIAGWRGIVIYSFIFYIMAAYALTLLPLPEITPELCELYRGTHIPRLAPFRFVGDIQALFNSGIGLIGTLKSGTFLQVFFNFLLLAPLGFYTRYLLRWNLLKTLLIAFLVSLSFELTQLTAIYGLYPCPYRLFDADDLILNTAGVSLGYLMVGILPFLPPIDAAHISVQPGQPVTLLRRFVAIAVDLFLLNISHDLLTSLTSIPESSWYLWLAIWFWAIPLLTGGATVGKWVVRLRLSSIEHPTENTEKHSVERNDGLHWWQPLVHYGTLLVIPQLVMMLLAPLTEPDADGYIEGINAVISFSIQGAIFLALVVPFIVRRDHRGLHELLAGTNNRVTRSSHSPPLVG